MISWKCVVVRHDVVATRLAVHAVLRVLLLTRHVPRCRSLEGMAIVPRTRSGQPKFLLPTADRCMDPLVVTGPDARADPERRRPNRRAGESWACRTMRQIKRRRPRIPSGSHLGMARLACPRRRHGGSRMVRGPLRAVRR